VNKKQEKVSLAIFAEVAQVEVEGDPANARAEEKLKSSPWLSLEEERGGTG
jgi:hypothetical protein